MIYHHTSKVFHMIVSFTKVNKPNQFMLSIHHHHLKVFLDLKFK